MHHPIDKAGSLVAGYADLILDDLRKAGDTPRSAAWRVCAVGWAVTVVVGPQAPGEGVAGLTGCDRDCLALLNAADEPLSAARVRDELERGRKAKYRLNAEQKAEAVRLYGLDEVGQKHVANKLGAPLAAVGGAAAGRADQEAAGLRPPPRAVRRAGRSG